MINTYMKNFFFNIVWLVEIICSTKIFTYVIKINLVIEKV